MGDPFCEQGAHQEGEKGKATQAALTAGGTQRGHDADDYPCDNNGNDCDEIFAVSISGVKPSSRITWFQAQQACMNSGKRLLTNAEWQGAAAGTVDPGTNDGLANTQCNTDSAGVRDTGNAGPTPGGADACISRRGVEDMVGNLWEWVGNWVPPATTSQTGLFGTGDSNHMTIDPTAGFTPSGPAALIRGGGFGSGASAGVFAVGGDFQPSDSGFNVGFRCGR